VPKPLGYREDANAEPPDIATGSNAQQRLRCEYSRTRPVLAIMPGYCTVDWTTWWRMATETRDRRGPLYLQIADQLREEIGSLDRGARIRSEPQLAKDWGVSRFTV
jgi:hypothetical protein